MRIVSLCSVLAAALLAGCSGTQPHPSKVYAAGEKAIADQLTYSVVDTEIQTRLGDDPSPRFPQTRFIVVHIAVSNGGSADVPVPGMTLVDDSGKSYPELADGTGVPRWLGIVRRVGPGQTERGSVLFDAPAGHYKLKVSDEISDSDVFMDIPLSFAHEQLNDVSSPVDVPAAGTEPAGPKKK